MNTPTIKLHEDTKQSLDSLKTRHESYDQIISNLLAERKHKYLKRRLIESYKSRSSKDIELLKEWDQASNELEEW